MLVYKSRNRQGFQINEALRKKIDEYAESYDTNIPCEEPELEELAFITGSQAMYDLLMPEVEELVGALQFEISDHERKCDCMGCKSIASWSKFLGTEALAEVERIENET